MKQIFGGCRHLYFCIIIQIKILEMNMLLLALGDCDGYILLGCRANK